MASESDDAAQTAAQSADTMHPDWPHEVIDRGKGLQLQLTAAQLVPHDRPLATNPNRAHPLAASLDDFASPGAVTSAALRQTAVAAACRRRRVAFGLASTCLEVCARLSARARSEGCSRLATGARLRR